MSAHMDFVQRTVIAVDTVVQTLLYGALDASVDIFHKKSPFFRLGGILSIPHGKKIMQKECTGQSPADCSQISPRDKKLPSPAWCRNRTDSQ